jgi:hypothetical protein
MDLVVCRGATQCANVAADGLLDAAYRSAQTSIQLSPVQIGYSVIQKFIRFSDFLSFNSDHDDGRA